MISDSTDCSAAGDTTTSGSAGINRTRCSNRTTSRRLFRRLSSPDDSMIDKTRRDHDSSSPQLSTSSSPDNLRRRAVRRFGRCATALAALLTAGVLQAAPASADVWVGSAYGTTTVNCGGGTIELTGMVTSYNGMPVMVADTLYVWDGVQWQHKTRDWTQVYGSYNVTMPGDLGWTYYVQMHYAFMTDTGWVVQSEWITDYQSGAYNALPYCYT